jgi:hypothetical protein
VYPQSYSVSYKPDRKNRTAFSRPIIGNTRRIGAQPRNSLLSRSGDGKIPAYIVTLVDAWPTKFELGALDANQSAVWISTLELRYNGIEIMTT